MTTLTVGSGKQYQTLSAAVAAAHDGDVVDVSAGTYTNDFATVTSKITIESVGGMANFVATVAPPNGKAILTVDASATLKGLGFSGAAVADANGAGIRQEAGSLTIDSCDFHGNQMGILTTNDASLSLTIQHSRFGGESTTAGHLAHQVYAGQIGSLDIENSLFLANGEGHQIKSRAATSTILNNVIDDQHGIASYDVDLPNGGNAKVEGNTIVKGADAHNTTMISYGEEGMFWTSRTNALQVDHNILDNQLASGGIGVNNHSSVTAHVDQNQTWHLPTLANGPNEQSGNVALSSAPSVNDAAPFTWTSSSPAPAPAPAPAPTPGTGTTSQHLSLSVSGDSWNGAPQFTVALDGHQIGGTYSTTALHDAKQWQQVGIDLGAVDTSKAHDLAVSFVNDAWGGMHATDRNLYVGGIDLDGHHVGGSAFTSNNASAGLDSLDPTAAVMLSNGTATWHLGAELWHV